MLSQNPNTSQYLYAIVSASAQCDGNKCKAGCSLALLGLTCVIRYYYTF